MDDEAANQLRLLGSRGAYLHAGLVFGRYVARDMGGQLRSDPMTDVLTLAARALARSQAGFECYDDLEPEAQEQLKETVREVLKAIREPSEAMVDMGAIAASRNDVDFRVDDVLPYGESDASFRAEWRGEMSLAWRAMIDAALTE